VVWERNPRQIRKEQAGRLADSLDEFGQVQAIAIGPDNEIYDGHQRKNVWAALDRYGPDYEVDVRVASRPLTEKEREKLVVYLHRGAHGGWDFDILANEFEVDDLLEWGFDEAELVGYDFGDDESADDSEMQNISEQWLILVECDDESQQLLILEMLIEKGYKCRALVS